MADAPNSILHKMLERLFASLVSGPGLNCRPHSSRQRIDLSQLSRLMDVPAEEILRHVLGLSGQEKRARLSARATKPKRLNTSPDVELSEEERRQGRQWSDQQTVIGKLRTIAEDARTYEQDTGVHVLNIGFPLLSVPPGAGPGKGAGAARRIIAPIAFIPVTLEVKTGALVSIEIDSKGEGVDLVRPNIALLAWLERQTGKRTPELFEDREAEDPWREICELVAHAAQSLNLQVPALFALADAKTLDPAAFALQPAPRAEQEEETGLILPAAVLGLYPMANEGLLRDMQAMAAGEALAGPVKSFLEVDVNLGGLAAEAHPEAFAGGSKQASGRVFAEERLVTHADPCQSRAALLARKADGLVIHGPPGTGKSQTITNIIGDHLARGERVLMVCDKRTALDVVAHRLEYLGFGPLIALVHDPQRDQRDLYKKIRDRLENLGDTRTRSTAARDVVKVDAELQLLHADLTAYWKSLMKGGVAANGELSDGGAGRSFHDLMGEWLCIPDDPAFSVSAEALSDVPLEEGLAHERLTRELLGRGVAADYARNPWSGNTALALRDLLTRRPEHFGIFLQNCAQAADKTLIIVDEKIAGLGDGDLTTQGELRLHMAEQLENVLALEQKEMTRHWTGADGARLKKGAHAIESQCTFIQEFRASLGKLDPELLLAVQENLPTSADIAGRLGKLNEYLATARKWYAFALFKKKSLAREVLTPMGLAVNAINADRAKTFLLALRARLAVRALVAELGGQVLAAQWQSDNDLDKSLRAAEGSIALLALLRKPENRALAAAVEDAMGNPREAGIALAEALRKSAARAEAIRALEDEICTAALWTPAWQKTFSERIRASIGPNLAGGPYAVAEIAALIEKLPTIENIVRIRDGLSTLSSPFAAALVTLLQQSAPPDAGMLALRKALLAAEISRRLREDSTLQAMDGQRLQTTFDRYRSLDMQKRTLVREAALHHWVQRQKERLLASTLTRMSPLGADLRRRLTMRGERAMRLRQVIDVGRTNSDAAGDPLFDMCPVWMASPETVAQIFPREPLFDVVIFDEASQCRLEEALPVLTRGKRVVIAGDPRQLPPTRFFESTITASEEDEGTTEQDLFERQQAEVEDLLTAALNLSIENAYLDVHYRSRNSDLIQFSNEQFYSHRLQAIPGRPDNRIRFCPLTLYRADGVYEERRNEKEALQVCRIVRDLLKRAEPPSIGIACFNLVQRDLIVEKLDQFALEDPDFARRLAAARVRRGAGSFEGLFVKNLENVQGDERDHIIISTTYGPQKDGRFHQRFGPLGRTGGGRRLNVLVTRARDEVHLVTSIPAQIYRALPPVPVGQTPGGAWLLYAYLQFAEQLAAHYAAQALDNITPEKIADLPVSVPHPAVIVHSRTLSLPSQFSEHLGNTLAKHHGIGSQIHWGNDGFCIDLALTHPLRPGEVTIGVLCDANRYLQAPDPVEWDLFRMAVHESQGWKLVRLWTPQFFHDAQNHLARIVREAQDHLANEQPPDALTVIPTTPAPQSEQSPAEEETE